MSLEEILANTETKAPEAKRPAEWTPGVQQTGDSAYCVTTPFPAHEDPDESELIASIGFNPEQWAISGDLNAGTWQKANGEWLKSFKFQLTRSIARDRHDIESLLKIVERRKPRPEGFVTNTNPAMVVSLNDWQVGKAREPEGGTPEMIDRLLISFAAVRARLRELTRLKRRPSMIVLANTGDLVEAVSGHYPSQPFIVDLNGREQLRVARRLLFRMVDELVSDGYQVLVTAVPCNHGENRNASGKAQTTPDDNASLTIVEGIEEACMANPDRYEGVSFAYAKDLTMVIDVSGVNLGLTHGHQIKGAGSGAASVEKWWQGQIMGCQPIASADILLTAHRHHFQISEETGRTVMLAPAMDGGSYWFTSTTGRSAPRGMLMVSIGDTYDRGWAELCIM